MTMQYFIGFKMLGAFPSGHDTEYFEVPEDEYDKVIQMINEKWRRV